MDVLKEGERIDDLEYKGLKIIQNKDGFCFGIDSVLISDFAKNMRKGSTVLDLGTGTGIISILLSKKQDNLKIYGIEIQEDVAEMASRSVRLNNLQDSISIINDNLKNLSNHFEPNSIDVIVTNPPYKKNNTGLKNDDYRNLVSRHEVECTLEDIISISKKLLKDNKSKLSVGFFKGQMRKSGNKDIPQAQILCRPGQKCTMSQSRTQTPAAKRAEYNGAACGILPLGYL